MLDSSEMSKRSRKNSDRLYGIVILIQSVFASVLIGLLVDVLWDSHRIGYKLESAASYIGALAVFALILALFFNEKHRQVKHKELISNISNQITELHFPDFKPKEFLSILSISSHGIVVDQNRRVIFQNDSFNVEDVTSSKETIVLIGTQYAEPAIYYATKTEGTINYAWNKAAVLFTDCKRLRSVAHCNGVFVAVGKTNSDHGAMFISMNGKDWFRCYSDSCTEVYSFWDIKVEGNAFLLRGTCQNTANDICYVSQDARNWEKI